MFEDGHHPLGHVCIKGVVGREDGNVVFFHESLALKQGCAPFDPEFFHFVRSGDNAAVVVAEHDYRFALQVRSKHPLAGDVKVIAVYQHEAVHFIPPYG